MISAFDDLDVEVRSMTIIDVCHKGPPLDEAVPLLTKALHDPSKEVRCAADHGLSHRGRELTAEEVSRIEQQIPDSPHELALRILLLGYYFLGQRGSETAREARHQHIFWLIRHAPERNVAGRPDTSIHGPQRQAYETAKKLWLEQVQSYPENTKILGNAASFFLINDSQVSEQLLNRARELEPDSPKWSERLGQLYSLRSGRNSPEAQTHARSALQELQRAERMRSDIQADSTVDGDAAAKTKFQQWLTRISQLPKLAQAAFDAREFQVAKNYAAELLGTAASSEVPEFFRNCGNAIHHGNLILGRVALQNGDLDQAKMRLIASAGTAGSPQLNSFGPNMSLAKDLLERGEREAVLEFFELCAKFWQHGSDRLTEWTRQVRAGEIPAFGANLRY